jgi:hypothetical protein
MKNKKHTIYTILIVIGSLASISIYIYVFSLIERNNVAIRNLQSEIKKIDNQKNKIRQIKKDIESTKDDRAELDQHFMSGTDIVRFFDSLDTESKIAKVGFSIVSASELKSGEPFKFTLKTVGNYDQNYHFLKILESLPYDLRMTDYTIKYTNQVPQTNTINGLVIDNGGWEMNVSLELLLKDK